MTDCELLDRFEELEAGRVLGDLDADEAREWEKLSLDPRCQSDLSLDFLAAALEGTESDFEEEIPPELLAGLEAGKAAFIVSPEPIEEEKVIRPSRWKKIFGDSETAWAIAALFILLFTAQFFVSDGTPEPAGPPVAQTPPSSQDLRDSLPDRAGDLVRSGFAGQKTYEKMSGEVVWSDELQEGYLTLTNLPANDPKAKQYQLWIVDPTRDEKPVDGGVFDISDDRTAVIPIRNPLTVNRPQAFVITLEQPGGVVVSKQEVVVALATTG